MNDFECGDKVIYMGSYIELRGEKGVIKHKANDSCMAVEFTKDIDCGHRCCGFCEAQRGLWLDKKDLKLIYEIPLSEKMTYNELMY